MVYSPRLSGILRYGCYLLGYLIAVSGQVVAWFAFGIAIGRGGEPVVSVALALAALAVSATCAIGGIRLITWPPPHLWPGEFAGTVAAGTDSVAEAERVVAVLKGGGIPAWPDPPPSGFEGLAPPARPKPATAGEGPPAGGVRIAVVVPAGLGRKAEQLLRDRLPENEARQGEGS